MDPAKNPFEPGAGTDPPYLVGRETLIETADAAVRRASGGRPLRGQVFYGIRGVGKTVLLRRITERAATHDAYVVDLETPEDRSLASLLVPEFRKLVIELSLEARAKDKLERAARALQAFAATFEIKIGDVGVKVKTPKGLADSGDLDADLTELFATVGELAKAQKRVVVISLDEMQYLSREDLSALLTAVHRANQLSLPIGVFGAGLPNLLARAGDAKSYSERLFQFVALGAFPNDDAERAIREPIETAGAKIDKAALALIVEETRGYPYFLQEWGFHAWNAAARSPIRRADVARASTTAIANLDVSFFRVRYDRLTPAEKRYLRAMAELGPGPHGSGEVARVLDKKVTQVATTRKRVIEKGMAYEMSYGTVDFTVPLFDEFMKREMPKL